MTDDKLDRRIRRTRRLLREALTELIAEKGYSALTIRDITERADVAYATFFRHYDGKDALLAEQVQILVQDLEEQAQEYDERYFEFEGQLIFKHIQANHDLYQKLLGAHTSYVVIQQFKHSISRVIRPHVAEQYKAYTKPQIPFEILLNHMSAAALELVIWWLQNKMPHSVEEMAHLYERLVIQASWQAVSEVDFT